MAATDTGPLCFEGFTLDPVARTLVDASGECISLRRSEFELLLAFASKPGRALSRDYLLEAVAGRPSEAFDRSIDVLVGRLRRKIEREPRQPKLITTVPGIGYRFAATPRSVRHDVLQAIVAPPLSIVVLPFTNFSSHPEQQYFADGITEDLTSDLSRIADSFVISRNTAFTYRDKRVDTKQIGRELGVRYVLEGSVRRSGKQVRVSAQLIDATTDAHLWTERFDRDIGDLFALQNEITSRIAISLNLELVLAEAARPIDNPGAFDYVIRGRAALSRGPTRANDSEAINLFERALELDPRSVEAKSLLATALATRVLNHMTETAETDLIRVERLVAEASKVSPPSSLSYYAKGQLLRARSRHEEAIPEYETVLALDRNCVAALAALGECKLYIGCIEQIIPLEEQAIRLSPRDPLIAVWNWWIGLAHLLQSRVCEAIPWFEKACRANPELPYVHSHLAAAYGLIGDRQRAAAELAEARRLRSGRYSNISQLKAAMDVRVLPKVRALYDATFFAGLRKAGMPED
jgi:adenylate cyclase